MNRIRVAAAVASFSALLFGQACARGIPLEELATPTGTGIPSPLPASYAWARAQLEGQLKGEYVTGDPQDSYERLRGRIEGDQLVVEIGFETRGVHFRSPPLRGGSRYVLRQGEGEFSLTIDGVQWSTNFGGVCSVIFGYVRGPQIPFFVPPGHQVYEADAGFVCAALESPEVPGALLSVVDGALHFFFVAPPTAEGAPEGRAAPQLTSTGTTPPTG